MVSTLHKTKILEADMLKAIMVLITTDIAFVLHTTISIAEESD